MATHNEEYNATVQGRDNLISGDTGRPIADAATKKPDSGSLKELLPSRTDNLSSRHRARSRDGFYLPPQRDDIDAGGFIYSPPVFGQGKTSTDYLRILREDLGRIDKLLKRTGDMGDLGSAGILGQTTIRPIDLFSSHPTQISSGRAGVRDLFSTIDIKRLQEAYDVILAVPGDMQLLKLDTRYRLVVEKKKPPAADQLLADALKNAQELTEPPPVVDKREALRSLVREYILQETRNDRTKVHCEDAPVSPHLLVTFEARRLPTRKERHSDLLVPDAEPITRSHQFGIVLLQHANGAIDISIYGQKIFSRGMLTGDASQFASASRVTQPQGLAHITIAKFDAAAYATIKRFLSGVAESFEKQGARLEQVSPVASKIYGHELNNVFGGHTQKTTPAARAAMTLSAA